MRHKCKFIPLKFDGQWDTTPSFKLIGTSVWSACSCGKVIRKDKEFDNSYTERGQVK